MLGDKNERDGEDQKSAEQVAEKERLLAVPAVHINPGDGTDNKNRDNGESQELREFHGRCRAELTARYKTNEGHLVDAVPELRDQLSQPESKETAVLKTFTKAHNGIFFKINRNIITSDAKNPEQVLHFPI